MLSLEDFGLLVLACIVGGSILAVVLGAIFFVVVLPRMGRAPPSGKPPMDPIEVDAPPVLGPIGEGNK